MSDEKKMYHVEWDPNSPGALDSFQETVMLTEAEFDSLCDRLQALEDKNRIDAWQVYEKGRLCDYDDILRCLDQNGLGELDEDDEDDEDEAVSTPNDGGVQ